MAFKVTKRRVLYDRRHPTFRDFQAAIQEVLDGLSTEYSQQLASLTTLNCQQFDDVSLIAAIGISYRQRLFVEHDLGGSSGSAVDAARRSRKGDAARISN